jgi:hypothetical protein
MFAGQGGLEAILHRLLTGPRDGVDVGVEWFGDPNTTPAVGACVFPDGRLLRGPGPIASEIAPQNQRRRVLALSVP